MVRALEIATTFLLGLLTGAMLLVGAAIVPYWVSLDASSFSAWFARNSSFLGGVMVPLGGTTTLFALTTAAVSWRSRSPARGYFVTAAAMAGVVAFIYLVEHASLNTGLGSGSLSDTEVRTALLSWRAWHWGRVGAGALGFLAGLVGLAQAGQISSDASN